jgi:hypothetical protein
VELIWILLAAAVGLALYRYFSGHGGIKISRANFVGLLAEGTVAVRGSEVRWSTGEADSFAAAWALPSDHWVAIRVTFDPEPDDEDDPDEERDADQGRLDLSVSERPIAKGVTWTDQITDRGLRADVEAVLTSLQRQAERSRSDRTRAATAKPVGTRKELD